MQRASTRTLYDYWNALRGARSAPDRRDIDPTHIRGALSNTFILEADETSHFVFRLAGSHLCAAYATELKGRPFLGLWHKRDRDAVSTLVRAVTEDLAVALINFQASNATAGKASFETLLLPLRHNGSTTLRLLGAMSAIEEPDWLGVQPVSEQRITGLRLIWPDEAATPVPHGEASAHVAPAPATPAAPTQGARRYAHLAVIDGGRERDGFPHP